MRKLFVVLLNIIPGFEFVLTQKGGLLSAIKMPKRPFINWVIDFHYTGTCDCADVNIKSTIS